MSREPLSLDLLSLSITHELRQPLSLIVGYAELLATREMPEPDRAAALAAIRRAAARLAGSLERLERGDATRRIQFGSEAGRELLDLRA